MAGLKERWEDLTWGPPTLTRAAVSTARGPP